MSFEREYGQGKPVGAPARTPEIRGNLDVYGDGFSACLICLVTL
jgi:hypothetical protein